MKYFIDLDTINGRIPQQILGFDISKWLSKPLPNIQMISIGIVSAEKQEVLRQVDLCTIPKEVDGDKLLDYIKDNKLGKEVQRAVSNSSREYYAISKDFNLKAAWNNEWVRKNVLKSIFNDWITPPNSTKKVQSFNMAYNHFEVLLNKYGKTNKQIAEEIIEFIGTESNEELNKILSNKHPYEPLSIGSFREGIEMCSPEFYGYDCAFDQVAFYQLFDNKFPKGFPNKFIDLKQRLDDKANILYNTPESYCGYYTPQDKIIKHINYPKPTNTNNSLSRAKHYYELYKFLNLL